LKPEDVKKLLGKFNIALSQLPKISKKDSLLPENCETGDVIRVERKKDTGEVYYRVVI
tara:strand:- start:11151 stop:11324 length:174 start_codon:yes stop_codon:yes gene_type:complete